MSDPHDTQSPPLNRGKNPLLYELAEVVRIVRERWTTEPQESPEDRNSSMPLRRRILCALRRFLYALAGTSTYIASFIVTQYKSSDGANISLNSASEPINIGNYVFYLSLILAPFFAFILSGVKKSRGPVALYLEGVALPAFTYLIIRYSIGSSS